MFNPEIVKLWIHSKEDCKMIGKIVTGLSYERESLLDPLVDIITYYQGQLKNSKDNKGSGTKGSTKSKDGLK